MGQPHPRPYFGVKSPIGARDGLGGRAAIVMDDWGPWDHASPLVRRTKEPDADVYEVLGAKNVEYHALGPGVQIVGDDAAAPVTAKFKVEPAADIVPYSIDLKLDGQARTVSGTLTRWKWDVLAFPWTKDPRTDHAGWLQERDAKGVSLKWQGRLDLPLAHGGPRGIKEWADHAEQLPGPDHYGLIASAVLKIPKGKWRITTLSDDGIKVEVIWAQRRDAPRKTIIDNMTWHAPTRDTGEFTIEQYMKATPEQVQIRVEYFQIDGHAALSLDLDKVD
jgi:hypothetical protein